MAACTVTVAVSLAFPEISPALAQDIEPTPDNPPARVSLPAPESPPAPDSLPLTFEITLDELGYAEETIDSPFGFTEYTLRLPEGWVLQAGSFLELHLSYTYEYIGSVETRITPSFFGDVLVAIDGEPQTMYSIREETLENIYVRVDLPATLLGDTARRLHTIKVSLNAGHICAVPHRASLAIHPTSSLFFYYDQLPITADLSHYPRPFYQQTFEPDQVLFVLPHRPTETEMTGAVSVAAKLGHLTSRIAISGTTDLRLLNHTEVLTAGTTLHEHLIVIGRPETNAVITRLNRLGVLPVPLRERQLSLATIGPATISPSGTLTYTLVLTNTARQDFSSLSLIDTLPAGARMMHCSPLCTESAEGKEIDWFIPSLEVGETLSYTLTLHTNEAISNSVIENTVTLFSEGTGPLNVNTLTTTMQAAPSSEPDLRSSVSIESGYFFLQEGRGVPEKDGVVQELVSPWDQTRAILVLTGLNDAAVYKACLAMSFESRFPGMNGLFALVREVRPSVKSRMKPSIVNPTLAELGYDDRVLDGFSQNTIYYFDLPARWHLTEDASFDLRFSHSSLLDYDTSHFNVLVNGEPVATVALRDETSLGGELLIELPPSLVRPGVSNRISLQSALYPLDKCVYDGRWMRISNTSQLRLDHREQEGESLDLDSYPRPFAEQPDLGDVLFVLPPMPQVDEWEGALRLAYTLGTAAGGSSLAPTVALGDTWEQVGLADYHIIAMGRPSRNPALQRLNEQLPQPFLPDSDEIEQRLDDVVLRLPSELGLGFVQLLGSPWNQERAFLAITGSTEEGVKQAVDLVVNRYWALSGNLVLVKDGEINTNDTRGLARDGTVRVVATAVPEMSLDDVVTTTAPPTLTPAFVVQSPILTSHNTEERNCPSWIVLLVIGTALTIIVIFAVAFWQTRQKRV
jgi:uncharacterized repeat protein (TIGR01451 family)